MVSFPNKHRSLKQRSLGEGDNLALYLVLWLAMCLFKIAIFEVDACLKWMLWQSKLKPVVIL